MTFSDSLFWILTGVTVGSALLVLLAGDIVHMAFWLLSSLAGFAGLYLYLGADFLGFVQVLVYIGGILILFLFGVMLTHRQDVSVRPEAPFRFVVPGLLAGVAATLFLVFGVVLRTRWFERPASEVSALVEPTTGEIGERFMTTYILPFEAVTVLLLVAMIGATYIARSREEQEGGEEE